jgi:hypothetical protein
MVVIHWLHTDIEEFGLEVWKQTSTDVNEPMRHVQPSVVGQWHLTTAQPRLLIPQGTKEQTLHPNTQKAKHDSCIFREIS